MPDNITKKKPLTVAEFASMGGKARAKKLTREQRVAIAKMGGRPKKGVADK